MNKFAAEKVAEHYYNMGVNYALSHTKQAGFSPLKFRNEVSTPIGAIAALLGGAGAGSYGGLKAVHELPFFQKGMKATELLGTLPLKGAGEAVADMANLGISGSLGLGAGLGGAGGGLLALAGAKKLLNKHNPIERYLDLGVLQVPLGKSRI